MKPIPEIVTEFRVKISSSPCPMDVLSSFIIQHGDYIAKQILLSNMNVGVFKLQIDRYLNFHK